MRKLIFLFFASLIFSTSGYSLEPNQVSGNYQGILNSFIGLDLPNQHEANIYLNQNGTWYIVCRQNYGGQTFDYPCDGKLYTWYIDEASIQYPVKLNYPGVDVFCKVAGSSTLYCYVKGSATDLLLSKDSSTILNCKYEFTLIDEIEVPSEGVENYKILLSTNMETCNAQYIVSNDSWIDISNIRIINETGERIIYLDIDNNTTSSDRVGSISLKETFWTPVIKTFNIRQTGNSSTP